MSTDQSDDRAAWIRRRAETTFAHLSAAQFDKAYGTPENADCVARFLDLHGLSVGHQVEAPGLVAPEQRGPSARPAARKAQAAPGRPGVQPQRHASSP